LKIKEEKVWWIKEKSNNFNRFSTENWDRPTSSTTKLINSQERAKRMTNKSDFW